jgi:hypothetical protein
MRIRVKVCLRCKEYFPIHPNNFLNNKQQKDFEKNHKGHNLTTILRSELPEDYVIFKDSDKK